MALEFSFTRNPQPVSDAERSRILENPGFGTHFTDHMVMIDWTEDKGWHDARVVPYGPLSLDPATNVFHYGQAIFEGIKAYRQPDGSIATFRPEKNAERLRSSARRLAMPELEEEDFINSLAALMEIDHEWVPAAGGEAALYMRPFIIATEATLGVSPSVSYTYLVIASPSGAYFANGVTPVSVWLCEDYVRAAPGGTGAAKCAGNYAASLQAQAQAAEKGCDQVVWLDAHDHHYVEEMGGMNLFFVYGDGDDIEIVTPELSGSLLAGVTRDSLLQVARDKGYRATERKITTSEWEEDARSGALKEVFACGTAAVITPVGTVKSNHGEFTIGDGSAGDVTLDLRETLTGIQRGQIADDRGWMTTLRKAG